MAPKHLLLLSYQQFYQRTSGNYNGFYFLNIDEGYYTKDTSKFHIHILPHQYLFFFWLLYNFYICARRVLLPLNSLLWEGDGLRLAGRTSVYTLICYRVSGSPAEIRTQSPGFWSQQNVPPILFITGLLRETRVLTNQTTRQNIGAPSFELHEHPLGQSQVSYYQTMGEYIMPLRSG